MTYFLYKPIRFLDLVSDAKNDFEIKAIHLDGWSLPDGTGLVDIIIDEPYFSDQPATRRCLVTQFPHLSLYVFCEHHL